VFYEKPGCAGLSAAALKDRLVETSLQINNFSSSDAMTATTRRLL